MEAATPPPPPKGLPPLKPRKGSTAPLQSFNSYDALRSKRHAVGKPSSRAVSFPHHFTPPRELPARVPRRAYIFSGQSILRMDMALRRV